MGLARSRLPGGWTVGEEEGEGEMRRWGSKRRDGKGACRSALIGDWLQENGERKLSVEGKKRG